MWWRDSGERAQEQADLDKLRREGFSERMIVRLYTLRQNYGQDEQDQPFLDRRRLEFARWLFLTGRLTDEECSSKAENP